MKNIKRWLFTLLVINLTLTFTSMQPLFSLSLPKIKKPRKPFLSGKKKPQSQKKFPKTPHPVTVFFFKPGVKFQGNILSSDFTLQLITEKQGFRFYKKLSLSQIKSITILEWKGRFYAKKQKVYVFLPIKYRIIDQLGNTYIYHKNIRALNRMDFSTSFGKTRFYSYYFDYIKNKKWAGLKGSNMSLYRSQALPKVIHKLVFRSSSIKKTDNKTPIKKADKTEKARVPKKK